MALRTGACSLLISRGSCAESTVFSRITADDIEAHLMTSLAGSPPLDVLIRTSGVKRLSDYMLWQVRGSSSTSVTS